MAIQRGSVIFTQNAWNSISYDLEYSSVRNGSNIVMSLRPIVKFNTGTSQRFDNRIEARVYTANSSWSAWQTVKGNTSGYFSSSPSYYGSWVNFTTANNTSSQVIGIQLRDPQSGFFSTGTFTHTVSVPPGIPTAPRLTLKPISRSQISVSWTSNMSVTKLNYRINGTLVQTNFSARSSGSFTMNGLEPGSNNSVFAQVYGPGGWSPASSTMSARTFNISTLNGITAKPLDNSINSVVLDYSYTQTGGSTTVKYRIGSGAWNTVASNKIITGLTPNTRYSIQLRAENSSGEVNDYPAVLVTTYAEPSVNFTLTEIDKTSIAINVTDRKNVTSVEYSFDNGPWVYMVGNRIDIENLTPGTTHSVKLRLKNSAQGVTIITNTKTLTLDSLSTGAGSLFSISRNTASIRLSFTSEILSYRYTFEGKTTLVENLDGKVFTVNLTNLTSYTNYSIRIQGYDKAAKTWGPSTTFSFRTSIFRDITLSGKPSLTHAKINIKVSDSIYLISINDIEVNELLGNGSSLDKNVFNTEGGTPIRVGVNESYVVKYKDQYGNGAILTSRIVVRTEPTPRVSNLVSNLSVIESVSEAVWFDSEINTDKYRSRVEISTGTWKISKYNNAAHYNNMVLSPSEILGMVSAATFKSFVVSFKYFFIDEGVESYQTVDLSLNLNLGNKLINMPSLNEIIVQYSQIRNEHGDITLSPATMLNKQLNTATVKLPPKPVVPGSVVYRRWIVFNGSEFDYSEDGNDRVIPPQSQFSGSTATLFYSDGRGLVNSVRFNINTFDYFIPTLNIQNVDRTEQFNKEVAIGSLQLGFSNPPVQSGVSNRGYSLYARVRKGEETTYGEPFEVIKEDRLGQSNLFYNLMIPYEFETNSAYFLHIQIKDRIGGVQEVTDIPITSGRATLFIDTLRSEVGVNTTTPRGSLDVLGDFYTNNQYSLNSFYYDEEDIEEV